MQKVKNRNNKKLPKSKVITLTNKGKQPKRTLATFNKTYVGYYVLQTKSTNHKKEVKEKYQHFKSLDDALKNIKKRKMKLIENLINQGYVYYEDQNNVPNSKDVKSKTIWNEKTDYGIKISGDNFSYNLYLVKTIHDYDDNCNCINNLSIKLTNRELFEIYNV